MIRKFFKWGFSSLLGHIVMFAVFWTIPMLALFLALNYFEGTLTLEWALYVVLYSVLGGLAVAVIVWFAIISPLIRRRGRRSP